MAATLASAAALAAALGVAGAVFARRAHLLVRLLRMGKPSGIARADAIPDRARQEAVVVLGQRKLFQRALPGVMHALIFWGFIVLFPTIVMAMIAIVDREATLPWLGEQEWFALLADVFAVLVLVGVATALWIRKVVRPARFKGSHLGEADLILAWISGIVITLLLWHAARIALGSTNPTPAPRPWRTCSPGCSATVPAPRCSSACSCGRTCCSSSASSPTSPTPSTCTSSPRASTSTSGAPAGGGGSSRCGSTTRRRPRRTSASASGRSRTSPGSR